MSQFVYHGSADKFDVVAPRRNRRFSSEGDIIWDEFSFHATPLRWIAISYVRSKYAKETTGVDLYEEKPFVRIYGSSTLEEALRNLYGQGGYLYEFDSNDFSYTRGLGLLEVATKKPVMPVRIERINDPVGELLRSGVRFRFEKRNEPKAL